MTVTVIAPNIVTGRQPEVPPAIGGTVETWSQTGQRDIGSRPTPSRPPRQRGAGPAAALARPGGRPPGGRAGRRGGVSHGQTTLVLPFLPSDLFGPRIRLAPCLRLVCLAQLQC